jgi:hypothetical protein
VSDQEQSERRDDRVQGEKAIPSDPTEESAAPGTSGGTKAIRRHRDAVVTIQGGGIFGLICYPERKPCIRRELRANTKLGGRTSW